ncbi:MAG: glutathione peroxidase [Gammaproteobacteria bacterium]|nr:glutathione peroxidase [Gammaproteobacteria bacterium]
MVGSLAYGVETSDCSPALDIEKRYLNSETSVNLCDEYAGNVILVVNTASKCGFTPQYDGLEVLYRRYRDRGFVVLGFPSNDFGGQEPGSEEQIQQFCRLTYSVEFPMFEKTKVAKENADPLYEGLAELSGDYPRWNFHKYLFNRNGGLVGSFPSQTRPLDTDLVNTIESLL